MLCLHLGKKKKRVSESKQSFYDLRKKKKKDFEKITKYPTPLFYSSRLCTTLKLNQGIKLLNQDPKPF